MGKQSLQLSWLVSTFLLVLVYSTAAQARRVTRTSLPAAQEAAARRSLLGNAFCPRGCNPNGCVQDATGGGLRCQWCLNNLLVETGSGTCVCPAGHYGSPDDSCKPCPKGSYCEGGTYNGDNAPAKTACPLNMTTLGFRAQDRGACVNLPGTFYDIQPGNTIVAVTCPRDTYSAGLKKQRQCVPCPTGYTTNGAIGQVTPTACLVPAGYYLKGPGQVAPCPRGEWKAGVGTDGNCTQCAIGVTTPRMASTSEADCTLLKTGFFALKLAAVNSTILETAVCPQKFVCPGGLPRGTFDPANPAALSADESTIKACPEGTWTQDPGSWTTTQCLTPPGFYTANGVTQQCPDASFRSGWKKASEADSCTRCGQGVLAEKTDRLTVFDPITYQPSFMNITTDSEDCYIQPGQGLLYETLSKTSRAQNCIKDNYGVTTITYGLTPAPCRDCPNNMVATTAAAFPGSSRYYTRNADGTGGFISPFACVTVAGYGYSGRVAQKCDQGTYNEGDNQDGCTKCDYGFTTTAPGAGRSQADCWVAPGHGANGTVCPIGTYNDEIRSDKTLPCKTCPLGTTTMVEGSDSPSDCQLCSAGYGGQNCATMCGGEGTAASYGPPGRALNSACTPCGTDGQTYGYSFHWNNENDIFAARTVSRPGAISPIDCVSEMGQLVDMSWYLPLSSAVATTVAGGVTSFQQCVNMCTSAAKCIFVTYDYVAKNCTVRYGQEVVYQGMPWVGFKVMPAGYTATNPWSITNNNPIAQQQQVVQTSSDPVASSKGLTTGLYTFWQDPNAMTLGEQYIPAGAANFTSVQQCLERCDDDGTCAGVILEETVNPALVASTCRLFRGDDRNGKFKRTVTRADLDRIGLPIFFLCLGERTGADMTGCSPVSTLDQITFLLRKKTRCDETYIADARQRARAYANNAENFLSGVSSRTYSLTGPCIDAAIQAGLTN